ncbi:tail fiber domain-containing protein, partial [Klebsiella pneumoniae]
MTQAIELSFSTPYIDFHFNYSTDDFTGRIMATAADQISVQGSQGRVDRDLRVGGLAETGASGKHGGAPARDRT